MRSKAFTLIELLVVVAIIGILAAVGVVAYNGYTGAAKANATKTIHAQTVKYISAEIKKCDLGETKYMVDKICPANAKDAVAGALAALTDKNPYKPNENAVTGGPSWGYGNVIIYVWHVDKKKIQINSCYGDGCMEFKEDTIIIE